MAPRPPQSLGGLVAAQCPRGSVLAPSPDPRPRPPVPSPRPPLPAAQSSAGPAAQRHDCPRHRHHLLPQWDTAGPGHSTELLPRVGWPGTASWPLLQDPGQLWKGPQLRWPQPLSRSWAKVNWAGLCPEPLSPDLCASGCPRHTRRNGLRRGWAGVGWAGAAVLRDLHLHPGRVLPALCPSCLPSCPLN